MRRIVILLLPIIAGILSAVAQAWLPVPWNALGNSATVWTAVPVAIVLATRSPLRWAWLVATVAFILLVSSFAIGDALVEALPFATANEFRSQAFQWVWIGVALATGPIAGTAAVLLTRRRRLARTLGAAILAGPPLVELSAAAGSGTVTAAADLVFFGVQAAAALIALAIAVARRPAESRGDSVSSPQMAQV